MNFNIQLCELHLIIYFHLINSDSIFDIWFKKKDVRIGDSFACDDGVNSCSVDLKFGTLNESYSQMLQNVILMNDDLPNKCRTDICFSNGTHSLKKGDLGWPETTIGERHVQKCPYSLKEIKYAYQDCLYSINNVSTWINYNDDRCPEPLFADEIKRIRINYKFERPNCSQLMTSFRKLNEIHEENPTHPIFSKDYRFITELFVREAQLCLTDISDLERDSKTVQDFLDLLFGRNHEERSLQIFIEAIEVLKQSLSGRQVRDASKKDANVLAKYEGQNMNLIHVTSENGRFNHDLNTKEHGIIKVSFDLGTQDVSGLDIQLYCFYHFKQQFKVEWTDFNGMIPLSILVYLNHNHTSSRGLTNNATHPLTVYFEDSSLDGLKHNGAVCSRYPYARATEFRWEYDCKTTWVSASSVRCDCMGVGFIAVLEPQKALDGSHHHVHIDDVAVFLGFAYNYELYLAGMALRAISIAALFITIVSYAIFKKTRKGVATRILLNLCFSLICLLIVLYVAEQRSNIKRECRIYNILRYYFILVSLMWNGMEAHNMYRMLIKVFNSHVRHFVRIAALVSWGIPCLFVSVVLLVDYKAFDGVYVKCTFGCSLKPWTMYFAWLIPMSIIILHNLIVFVMVVRILCQDRPVEIMNEHEQENVSSRLCGAFGVLVLLGVPWLLSAFGVLKSQNDGILHFQGVVGVVFVVFVSLQGLFIFLFHCVRNPQVRSHWWSTITGSKATRSSSDSRSSKFAMIHASRSTTFDKKLIINPQ